MRFKRETAGALTDFKTRQASNQRLDEPIPEPRICAEQHAYAWKASSTSKIFQTHVYALKQAYAWKMFKPSLSYEDPRICVEACRSNPEDQQVSYAYAWET
ncbi:hypothetical protein PIB30_100151 [Stylosanthes scabra]|uniref:Uncharacterized protein n=1 Tax=Stylosanthes scabra TaxID=79078 RepID=A0ABU6XZH0_9FABA|nr:hypothetical protein [Stylosanthes scabra]